MHAGQSFELVLNAQKDRFVRKDGEHWPSARATATLVKLKVEAEVGRLGFAGEGG